MMHLEGRVFARLHQFAALPTALQHETNALTDYLTQHQHEIFAKHHTLHLKSIYSVRTKHLLEEIDLWIQRGHAGHVTGSTGHSPNVPHTAAATGSALAPTTAPTAPTAHAPVDDHLHSHSHRHKRKHAGTAAATPHAKTLLDALVLKGFVAPYKEEKHANSATPMTTTTDDLKAKELLVPLSKFVTGEVKPTTSVWDLVDGAVFAGTLKRKKGLLEPLTHGKDVYAIVNARYKTLTLFATDLGRDPLVQLEAASMQVAFDTSRYDHGVKVWTTADKELLNAANQTESDALVHALLAVGATHDKRHFLDDKNHSPTRMGHGGMVMHGNADQAAPVNAGHVSQGHGGHMMNNTAATAPQAGAVHPQGHGGHMMNNTAATAPQAGAVHPQGHGGMVMNGNADHVPPQQTTENGSLMHKIGRIFSRDEHDKSPQPMHQKDHTMVPPTAP